MPSASCVVWGTIKLMFESQVVTLLAPENMTFLHSVDLGMGSALGVGKHDFNFYVLGNRMNIQDCGSLQNCGATAPYPSLKLWRHFCSIVQQQEWRCQEKVVHRFGPLKVGISI